MKSHATAVMALALFSCAPSALAFTSFGEEYVNLQVYCDLAAIEGRYDLAGSRYASRGACVEVSISSPAPSKAGQSQFDDPRGSKETQNAPWTAEGTWNPDRREARETITIPPPRIDEKLPVPRPYGRITTVMTCPQDPWLHSNACLVTNVIKTPTLDLNLEKMLTFQPRPFTARMKPAQNEALWQAKRRHDALLAAKQQPATSMRANLSAAPRIVQPHAGSTHPPQTALKVRVAAPIVVGMTGYKVSRYDLVFERRDRDGQWKPLTQVGVAASEIEGLGYVGWGAQLPGSSPQMAAAVGSYRVRADVGTPRQAKLPELNQGTWLEFVVAGEPAKDTVRAKASPRITGAAASGLAQPQTTFRRTP